MNKSDIVNEISKNMPDKSLAVSLVDEVFGIISSTLKKDEKVVISNFGTFRVRVSSPREYKNPKTKEKTMLASRKIVKFKPSKNFF